MTFVQRTGFTRDETLLGRGAVYTTHDGRRIVGVLSRDPHDVGELRIVMADGRWGRADNLIELV